MAEEHRCQAPEGHYVCANNCGFFGSPATMNLCPKCYGDYCLKEEQQRQQQQQHPSPIKTPAPSSSSSPSPAVESLPPPTPTQLKLPEVRTPAETEVPTPAAAAAAAAKPNRCLVCRKRVGLTGFRCRCGTTFCGVHRYPEKHGCSFDYKKVGREEIARANPVVVAEKLEKI